MDRGTIRTGRRGLRQMDAVQDVADKLAFEVAFTVMAGHRSWHLAATIGIGQVSSPSLPNRTRRRISRIRLSSWWSYLQEDSRGKVPRPMAGHDGKSDFESELVRDVLHCVHLPVDLAARFESFPVDQHLRPLSSGSARATSAATVPVPTPRMRHRGVTTGPSTYGPVAPNKRHFTMNGANRTSELQLHKLKACLFYTDKHGANAGLRSGSIGLACRTPARPHQPEARQTNSNPPRTAEVGEDHAPPQVLWCRTAPVRPDDGPRRSSRTPHVFSRTLATSTW